MVFLCLYSYHQSVKVDILACQEDIKKKHVDSDDDSEKVTSNEKKNGHWSNISCSVVFNIVNYEYCIVYGHLCMYVSSFNESVVTSRNMVQ